MIIDGEKWHHLSIKKLHALLRGVTSKHVRRFYCLNCFHSNSTKDKLEKRENVCENHVYGCVEMPKEDKKILKYNDGKTSLKVPFIIFADVQSLLKKMST